LKEPAASVPQPFLTESLYPLAVPRDLDDVRRELSVMVRVVTGLRNEQPRKLNLIAAMEQNIDALRRVLGHRDSSLPAAWTGGAQ
jgi:hypothetical protein